MNKRARFVATLLVAGVLISAAPVSADPINPWDLNVYSLGDIGTPSAKYSSDFQGVAGAGGSTYFSGFSLHDVAAAGPGTPFSLYAGGVVEITGAINHGGIEAAGDVSILGASVSGPVVGGGNLLGTGGTITGNVTLAGSNLAPPAVTILGSLNEGVPYAPTLDLGATSNYFLDVSAYVGNLAPTTTAIDQWGELQITVESGLNVIEFAANQLDAAWGVQIDGPSDATVLLNVRGDAVAFDSLVWEYTGGVSSSHALLNLAEAESFAVSGGNHLVNILAPEAETDFAHGLITGNFIVESLTGGGQVNAGRFDGTIPEPAALTLLLLGSLLLGVARRRA